MTDFPDSHRDLLELPVATLATIGSDGGPQLTEVWFIYDDGRLRISLNSSRVKTRNLIARPQCSLFLIDTSKPMRYVDVRGRATVEPDDDYALASKIDARYGAEVRDHDGPGDRRLKVTIEPTKVYAVDMGG